jgi:ribosomal protein L27
MHTHDGGNAGLGRHHTLFSLLLYREITAGGKREDGGVRVNIQPEDVQ